MTTPKTLLMLGDSLVEWGDWETLLPALQVINRGIAGEHVENLAARLTDEIMEIPAPDHILLMAGTNNLLMGSDFFPSIFSSMLPRLVALCPETTITVNSIMPMSIAGLSSATIDSINQMLNTVSQDSNCLFLDMTAPFTEQCLPITKPGFLADGVHLSTHGYQVWAAEISRHLQESG